MGAYATVMVGTDGSTSSFKAVEKAARIAADAGATLILVTAYRPMDERSRKEAADKLGDEAYKVSGSSPAESILSEAEDLAFKAGVKSVVKLPMEGDPVDALVDAAAVKKVDLLIIGNRGLNSLSGRLLGSVPQNVSHKAACDVLIVHTTGK